MITQDKQKVVIMPFGNGSLESPWVMEKKDRDFDVILLFYHENIPTHIQNDTSGSFKIYHLKNFKWIMIQDLFVSVDPGLLDKYEYFFFIDDDVEIDKNDIHFLFQNMSDYDLEMSQPALTRDSYKSWRCLRRKLLSGLRYVSSVELMCPMMSKRCVELLLPTFALNRSGWGIDILWGRMVREKFGNKSIAVFDTIRAKHSKPVGCGELYEKLGNPAEKERDEIFEKYKLEETRIFTLKIPENGLLKRLKSFRALTKAKKDLYPA